MTHVAEGGGSPLNGTPLPLIKPSANNKSSVIPSAVLPVSPSQFKVLTWII